jgi:tetratricopeptide (TPR) repeat protein/class 3 adenylate cyclase
MSWERRLTELLVRLGGHQPDFSSATKAAQVRWEQVQLLFSGALDAGDDAEAYLARACAGDTALAQEVRSLLAAHRAEGVADKFDGSSPETEPDTGDRITHYVIESELGRGGMGLVYAARDERLNRAVALKLLSRFLSTDPSATRRFLQEARSAAALDHPSICSVHEIGETGDGRLFIAMPLYQGETLAARLARGPLPVADALELAREVALGLGHAHARGIIHRDIKPPNLFLVTGGGIKILDFGIAKMGDTGSLTAEGSIVGTIPYMSPEQVGNETVDPRSDLWSLGVVLYEMIAGRRPFDGATPQATLASILTGRMPPLDPPHTTGPVADLVARLLALEPDKRLPDAQSLCAEIDRIRDAAANTPVWEGAENAQPIAAGGERRQVAVLVSQVDNYAGLVERYSPDELEELLKRYRAAAVRVASRHGGVLHQFDGEALTMLFGVPVTHEDDIQRSARAARELRDWAGTAAAEDHRGHAGFALRSGISAGMIAIQPDRARRMFRLAGHPLDDASRLASYAGAGELLAGPECERPLAALVAGRVETPVTLSGGAAMPLRIAGDAGSASARGGAGPVELTPFTGRERELAQLVEGLRRALAGEGQFVTISGDAGAGKSRLLHELTQAEPTRDFRDVRVHCRAPGAGTRPYAPLAAAVRELLELPSADSAPLDPVDFAARLRAGAPELSASESLLFDLFGVADEQQTAYRHLDSEQYAEAMREALVTLFTLASRARPLLLVFEDWHWVDDASHAVLAQLAQLAPAWPLAVIVTTRPGVPHEWPVDAPLRDVALLPLTAGTTATIIAAITGARRVPDDTVAAIQQRSGGNPFFVEELCHALHEDGSLRVEGDEAVLAGALEAQRLPGTIQGVIRTRLDRLDPVARDVARAAAVAGREFSSGMVRALLGDDASSPAAIDRLVRAGLVHQTRVAPEPAYRFKHILTQEVAYDSLLAHQRRALHARLGAALEAGYGDRSNEHAGTLAHHFSRAEAWPEAVRYGREEARQAAALSDFPRALRVLDQVELWAQRILSEPDRRELQIGILLEQERLCESMGRRRRQQEILARLRALLDPQRDQAALATVHLRQADLWILQQKLSEAQPELDSAVTLGRETGNIDAERGALNSLGMLFWHRDRSAEGLVYLQQAVALDRARDAQSLLARDFINISTLERTLGNLDAAHQALEQAREAAEAAGDTWLIGTVHFCVAGIYRLQGKDALALEKLNESLTEARTCGTPLQEVFCLTAIAGLLGNQGNLEAAIASHEEAVRIARKIRDATGLIRSLPALANLLLRVGRQADGLACLYEAAELFGDMEDRAQAEVTWSRIGELEEERKAYQQAADAWIRVRHLRAAAGNQEGELEALLHAGRSLRNASNTPSARALFREGLDLALQLEDRPAEAELRNAAGILEWRTGNYEQAIGHYEAALAAARASRDRMREGLALNSIGASLLCLHRVADARRCLEEAVALNHDAGQELLEGHALASLGDALLAAGDVAGAKRQYESSLDIRRRIRDRRGEGWMLHQCARVSSLLGDAERAVALEREARAIALDVRDAELLHATAATADDEPAAAGAP